MNRVAVQSHGSLALWPCGGRMFIKFVKTVSFVLAGATRPGFETLNENKGWYLRGNESE